MSKKFFHFKDDKLALDDIFCSRQLSATQTDENNETNSYTGPARSPYTNLSTCVFVWSVCE